MRRTLRVTTAAATIGIGALVSGALLTAPADAANGVTVVASGLNGPFELQFAGGKRLVVAESEIGQITQIDVKKGTKKALVKGLNGPAGVDVRAGTVYIAEGEGGGMDVRASRHGTTRQLVDLYQFELKNNPDRQLQFGPDGKPIESTSNPYYVLADTSKLLVADAAGNDVLKVDRKTGKTSVWFLPPVVKTGGCEQRPENDPGTFGCDPTPTGIAKAKDGTYWISTLGGLFPGAGRIYHVSAAGKILGSINGLTAPTGVAVGNDGSVYFSQVAYGLDLESDGPPPPGFDPSNIGRIVRVAPNGAMSAVQVTMPTGIVFRNGALYSSAWALAGELGLGSGKGQVVRIAGSAFTPISSAA